MSLYKLVTTENVDLNYKAFEKYELIDCISNLRTTYFRLKKENEEVEQLKEVIEKAIDKLYCWGEALNPEFQKKMLDILNGVE